MPGKKKTGGKKKPAKTGEEINHLDNDQQESGRRISGDTASTDTELPEDTQKANKSGPSETKLDVQSFINNELTKRIQQLTASTSAAKDIQEAKQHNYQFWQTQPVPKLGKIFWWDKRRGNGPKK